MKKIRLYLFIPALIAFSALFFSLAGCDDNTDEPTGPQMTVEAPTNVKVALDAILGGGSFATITWSASASENMSDFQGYVVVTDSVTANGTRLGRFADSIRVSKSENKSVNIVSIKRGQYYKSYVFAVMTNGQKSNAAQSITYAGVYADSASIDELSTSSSAMSGFGWDRTFFSGTQYPFGSSYYQNIDMHLRQTGSDLSFVSPQSFGASHITLYSQLPGTGEEAFNSTENLAEPNLTTMPVRQNTVYLLKTYDNYYIKVWVTSISQGGAFRTVNFLYKAQPIEGFKVLKR